MHYKHHVTGLASPYPKGHMCNLATHYDAPTGAQCTRDHGRVEAPLSAPYHTPQLPRSRASGSRHSPGTSRSNAYRPA